MTLVYNDFISELCDNTVNFRKIKNKISFDDYFNILKKNILCNFNVLIKNSKKTSKIIPCKYYDTHDIVEIDDSIHDPKMLVNSVVTFDNYENNYYFIKSSIHNKIDKTILLKLYPQIKKAHTMKIIGYYGNLLHQYSSCIHMMNRYDEYEMRIKSIIDPLIYIKGEYLPSSDNIKHCNESQSYAINSLQHSLEIIHGPPGTGKSTTIVKLIENRIPQSHTILCTAVQNQAIESLAIKLLESKKKFIVLGSEHRLKPISKSMCFDILCETNIDIRNLQNKIDFLSSKSSLNYQKKKYIDTDINNIVNLNKQINKIKIKILSEYNIFLCTTASSFKIYRIMNRYFDTIIMDEAAATTEVDMPPLLRHNSKNIILVGDHMQLRGFDNIPTYLTNDKTYNISLLERVIHSGRNHCMLNIQYRMNPQISKIVSDIFYNGEIHNGIQKEPIYDANPIKWINVTAFEIIENNDMVNNNSYYNMEEIHQIIKQINLYKNRNILILTSYNAQLQKMKEMINHDNVDIRTIDSSQGMECDVVICSLVRSNKTNNIGFLKDKNRLCVALSRAKNILVIVGNYNIFASQKNSIWQDITDYFSHSIQSNTKTLKCINDDHCYLSK